MRNVSNKERQGHHSTSKEVDTTREREDMCCFFDERHGVQDTAQILGATTRHETMSLLTAGQRGKLFEHYCELDIV